jgi:hypothetical protein
LVCGHFSSVDVSVVLDSVVPVVLLLLPVATEDV